MVVRPVARRVADAQLLLVRPADGKAGRQPHQVARRGIRSRRLAEAASRGAREDGTAADTDESSTAGFYRELAESSETLGREFQWHALLPETAEAEATVTIAKDYLPQDDEERQWMQEWLAAAHRPELDEREFARSVESASAHDRSNTIDGRPRLSILPADLRQEIVCRLSYRVWARRRTRT